MIGNKGASETAVDWFVAMAFTVLIVTMLLIIVSAYKVRTIDTSSIDPEIYVSKLYFSQEILKPESNMLLFGVIDEESFTTEKLNVQNEYGDLFVGARLWLLEADNTTAKGPIFNNKEYFEEKYPLAVNNILGPGGATIFEGTYPILISNNGIRPGYVKVEVVVPR